ncbi:MAG: hypothetical protein DRO18_03230, partial [Thermoprotei archaeon]
MIIAINKLTVLALLTLLVAFSSMSRTMPYRYIVSALLGVIAVTLGLPPLSKILDYIDLDVIGLIIGMSIM